jgi:hypothetical protein
MNPSRQLIPFRQLGVVLPLLLLGLAACSDNSTDPSTAFTGSSGFRLINAGNPIDLTPDGSTALLQETIFGGKVYFYDLSSGKLTLQADAGPSNNPGGISVDHRFSATYGDPGLSSIWSKSTGWLQVPSLFPEGCDAFRSSAWDISADGHTWVGMDWDGCFPLAVRWSDATGSVVSTPLERIGSSYPGSPNPPVNRATKVSDDGRVAGGFAETENTSRNPAIWGADGLGQFLTSGLPNYCDGEVLAMNADGSIVAGTWCGEGFFWKDGTTTLIGSLDPDGNSNTLVNAIAANGNLLFGGSNDKAFVWTQAAGMRPLRDVAAGAGIEFPPQLTLTNVLAASTDGTIVLGQAFSATSRVSFILKLPLSAYGL